MRFRTILAALALALVALPATASAQDAVERQDFYRARVTDATASVPAPIEGTAIVAERQTVTVQVLDGQEEGRVVSFENDAAQVAPGDTVYVRHTHGGFSAELWALADPYRLDMLLVLGIIFVALVFAFGGGPGVRGLATLAGSLVLIFSVLLPGIYGGFSPVVASLGVASVIIVLGSYMTHGFTRTTTAAMLGMIATVLVTGAIAYLAILLGDLTGFASEESAYLNFAADGRIDLVGLLFGGIVIGLLGVLYDSAIGQAVAVEELYRAGTGYGPQQVFARGLRIGREHIGALVNTLAIAYVGASLPLFLLLVESSADPLYLLNSERFATEIVRILASGIGIVLAVPVTTLIATAMLRNAVSGTGSASTHHHAHQ